MTASRYVLARRPGMQLDDFARCGLHPDMVRRLVALGLVAASRTPAASCGSNRRRW